MRWSVDDRALSGGLPQGIRDVDLARDRDALISCVGDLQEYERYFDAELPAGERFATRYFDAMLQRCRAFRGRILVAEDQGRVVGFMCVLGQVPEVQGNGRTQVHAMLGELYMAPEHRSQGVGRVLVDAAETHARSCGARRLRVQVLAGNEPARALYDRAGFAERLVELEKRLD